MILLAGIAVLSFKLVIPESWARFFGACVGIMLIGLGLSVGMSLVRETCTDIHTIMTMRTCLISMFTYITTAMPYAETQGACELVRVQIT